jgi:3-isopropylmalate dehydrogenase
MEDLKRELNIGILYGEGIGYEIINHTKQILSCIGKRFFIEFNYIDGPTTDAPLGNKREIQEQLYEFYSHAIENGIPIISGALSGGLVYDIRKKFDLYYKLIPLQAIPGYRTEVIRHDVDILLIRHNNAGEYLGDHGCYRRSDTRIAYQEITYSDSDIDKIAAISFKHAATRKGKITLLIKDDGFPEISDLWREIFQHHHKKTNDIELQIMNVDRGAGELISNPAQFDVVVTLNHDGDIVCDALVAFIYGSRGMGYSGNFNDSGFASYQTVHGAAVDLVGKDKANPIGQILSAAMMLEYSFGLQEAAKSIRQAIATILQNDNITADLPKAGKVLSTSEMCALISANIEIGCA